MLDPEQVFERSAISGHRDQTSCKVGQEELGVVTGVGVDSNDNIYVAQSTWSNDLPSRYHNVYEFDGQGNLVKTYGDTGLKFYVALDGQRNVLTDQRLTSVNLFDSRGTLTGNFTPTTGLFVAGLGVDFQGVVDVGQDGSGQIFALDPDPLPDSVEKVACVLVITITFGPEGKTNQTSPSFAWSSDEPGSSYQCRLDGSPWEPGSSPKSYTNLAGGSHVFKVAGSSTATSASAPHAPSGPSPPSSRSRSSRSKGARRPSSPLSAR
jgi:hypothetical protein